MNRGRRNEQKTVLHVTFLVSSPARRACRAVWASCLLPLELHPKENSFVPKLRERVVCVCVTLLLRFR